MACGIEGWYTAPPLAVSRALTGLVLVLLLGGSAGGALGLEPPTSAPGQENAPAAPTPRPDLADEVSALRDDVGALWLQIDRLTDGEDPPSWATREHDRLDQRLERITTLLESLSARVETPIPRLDEPITLLTVSFCTLILGFLAGRGLQRRHNRKDSRFRL